MKTTYLSQLASFASQTPGSDIPDDVRRRAVAILTDCIGAILAGVQVPEVDALLRLLGKRQAEPVASVLGTSYRLMAPDAAFVYGTAGTWHDLDEGNLHTRAHAAIQLVPALLAEADVKRVTGRALIDAFVFAYEVGGRLWRATQARFAVHPHGTYGPLAGAVALSRLRNETAEQLYAAMNIAMTLGIAASRQTLGDGATIRNTYSGHSGRASFDALAFRDIGLTGEHDAPGSLLGHLYGEAFDPAIAVADLNDVWWMRKSYFKRFASGRYVHGALDAFELLLDQSGGTVSAGEIDRIDVATFHMAATMGQQHVDSAFGMRFSIPALLAGRIVVGRSALIDDGARVFADPRVHQLAQRVFVAEAPAATAAYPDCQPTRVTMTLKDGRQETVSVDKILGESDHPLPAGALGDKFVELATPALGIDGARECYARLGDIDGCDDVATLLHEITTIATAQKENAT